MRKVKKIVLAFGLVLLLGALGLYAFFQLKNVEQYSMDAEVRKSAAGKFVALTDGMTHYELAGPDTAQTIILVHGFSVPAYIWGGTFDSLVNQGFRVVRYDEFGRGFSDRPKEDYSPSFYRRQLLDLIQSLKLKTPVHLAGLSFGGAVVSDFITHHPDLVDKVVLIDPVYRFRDVGGIEMVVNYKMAMGAQQQANGQLEDFKYPELFPDWVERYKVQMKYRGFRHALISTLVYFPSVTIVANYHKLGRFNKKILLIWGKEDQTVTFNFSDSIRQLLQVEFLPVEDARHLPHLEKPQLVNQKISSFLK